MSILPITRVVLYKHGVGYFEREGPVDGEVALALTFKQAEVSDVLKSLTVLDLNGGHIASVSYDSARPLEQLLQEVALSIPDQSALEGLLPQLKGARVALRPTGAEAVEGVLLGIDTIQRQTADGIVRVALLAVLTDAGQVRSFDLHELASVELLDPVLRRDLDYYLRTHLSSKKKEARTFTFFAQGEGRRTVRISYVVAAPVWKATYRIILGEGEEPLIQGWAVVDNTQDEDWDGVELALVAGLPVSFVHDLYTPRYIRRPVVAVEETTGVLPPVVEEGVELAEADADDEDMDEAMQASRARRVVSKSLRVKRRSGLLGGAAAAAAASEAPRTAVSSAPAQVRERKIGDLFEYRIEHAVTIRRNQSALVPILLRPFKGRPVLLYNREARAENPMRCVELTNTTGLTLEGGPITVLEGGSYVGEAMLDTLKPDEQRLVPYAVELSVRVTDTINSHDDRVHRIVVRRGQLKAHYAQISQTTYTLNSKGESEQTVYLDHPRYGKDWKLIDTPEPHETTDNHWRFRFVLPGRRVTQFVVRQRRALHQSYTLSDIGDQQLELLISQRYVDEPTTRVLRQVGELRGKAAGIEAEVAKLEQERQTIHEEQKRIRDNLKGLGERSSEKELRERFVRTLGSQEDRLDELGKELRKQRSALERVRSEVDGLLSQLEYEADL